ncbi:hypothetical protein [Endozoicomonas acroporae]|uniref:hypothetical protein n=1 Tax=Endozoicomonas acroporae TaxID=1701104 RepID=UPI003D7A2918
MSGIKRILSFLPILKISETAIEKCLWGDGHNVIHDRDVTTPLAYAELMVITLLHQMG